MTDRKNAVSRTPKRIMAWLAFTGIIAVIAVAIISDELANQIIILAGMAWLAMLVLIWYVDKQYHGKIVDALTGVMDTIKHLRR